MSSVRWLTVCFALLLGAVSFQAWSQEPDAPSAALSGMTPDEIVDLDSAQVFHLMTKEKLKDLSEEQQAAVRTVMGRELARDAGESRSKVRWTPVGLVIVCLFGIFIRRMDSAPSLRLMASPAPESFAAMAVAGQPGWIT